MMRDRDDALIILGLGLLGALAWYFLRSRSKSGGPEPVPFSRSPDAASDREPPPPAKVILDPSLVLSLDSIPAPAKAILDPSLVLSLDLIPAQLPDEGGSFQGGVGGKSGGAGAARDF